MGLTIEEQREKIRSKKREISENILKNRIENRFYLNDYFVKGIYFLYNDDNIVYIGKSDKNVFNRITDHYNENVKKFNSFTFNRYDVSDEELLKIEKSLIKRFKPKYNKIHNTKPKAKIYYGLNR